MDISITVPTLKSKAYTLWLFTRSDLKTFITPQVAFGLFSALSGPLMTTNPNPSLITVFRRLPLAFLWVWLNTLVFDLANQRLPSSIEEDKLNKPWRPMPAGRLSPMEARRTLLLTLPISFVIIHFWLGATEETIVLFVLTWMYNDLGGGDDFFARAVLLALAFVLYGLGALRVLIGESSTISPQAKTWLGMISLIILTTLHVQDLRDIVGDRIKGRKTVPLIVGELVSRGSLTVSIIFWSIFCCAYWSMDLLSSTLLCGFGTYLAMRLALKRDVSADRKSYGLWAAWILALYTLPCVKFCSMKLNYQPQLDTIDMGAALTSAYLVNST